MSRISATDVKKLPDGWFFEPTDVFPDGAICTPEDADTVLYATHRGWRPQEGRRLCGRCPVQGACLNFALTNGEHAGMWGGTTEDERHVLRRRLNLPDAPYWEDVI